MCDKQVLGKPVKEKIEEKKNNNNNCPVEQTPQSEEAKKAEEKLDEAVFGHR